MLPLSHRLTSALRTKDYHSDSSKEEDTEDSGDKEESGDEEEIEANNKEMVTPKKKFPTKAATSTSTTKAKKSKLSEVEYIAKSISGISISTADVFSVKCVDPIFRRKLVLVEEYGLVKD